MIYTSVIVALGQYACFTAAGFVCLQTRSARWGSTAWQRRWIWPTTPRPSNTSTWNCSEPRGTSTSPVSPCCSACKTHVERRSQTLCMYSACMHAFSHFTIVSMTPLFRCFNVMCLDGWAWFYPSFSLLADRPLSGAGCCVVLQRCCPSKPRSWPPTKLSRSRQRAPALLPKSTWRTTSCCRR